MKKFLWVTLLGTGLTALPLTADDTKPGKSENEAKSEVKKTDDTKVSKEAKQLLGDYEIVSGERNGQKFAPGKSREVTVRIAANAITTFDKQEKQVFAATYELDSSKKPWRITMTAKIHPGGTSEATGEGLIEANGNEVKLIYALPGGKPPTEFKTSEGQQMFLLKKKVD